MGDPGLKVNINCLAPVSGVGLQQGMRDRSTWGVLYKVRGKLVCSACRLGRSRRRLQADGLWGRTIMLSAYADDRYEQL